VVIRPAVPADAEACGRICYEAFAGIAIRHGFAPDFPSPAVATGLLAPLIEDPGYYAIVAEVDGVVVGSNFVDERSPIAGIGPITVDPAAQDAGIGRALMDDVLARYRAQGRPGIRLVQAAYHTRSLALYTGLGFTVREPLLTMQGPQVVERVPGLDVRAGTEADLDSCNGLCTRVHGHDRAGEVAAAAVRGTLRVVEHDGRLVGYTTAIAFFAHAVAESNDGLKALIADAAEYGGPGFLLPARNTELARWCLGRGLRIVHLMTLMSIGLYNEPAGAFLPSILY
jgi:ribosomal protein S18 acetylase RimI-like enzyme